VTRLRLISNRIVVCAMEPRSAVAHYDKASDRYTFHAGNQGVFGLKHQMADLLRVKPQQMRVLTGNVGGSFGMKGSPYPEYAGMFHASKLLGRPVKWTDDRSGSFLSDQHGRDHDFDAELALDKDGSFLAVRLTGYANVGGYLANVGPLMGSAGVTRNLAAIYRTPLIEVSSKVAFTNTSPVGAYRGAGRPEANYFMERLIETAGSARWGLDAVAMRKRNHIKAEEMPFKTASATVYDFGRVQRAARQGAGRRRRAGFATRKAESQRAASCAASASATISRSRRRRRRRWAASASSQTATSPSSPARSTTARATGRRSPRC
jgi:carbon-monoxide dehydrogenase large subunit